MDRKKILMDESSRSVQPKSKKFFTRGWAMVFVVFIVAVITQGMGIFSFSMLRGNVAAAIGVEPVEIAAAFSFFVMTMAIVGMFVGLIIEKIGIRFTLILSAIIFGGGFILQPFLATSVALYYFDAVLLGAGSALGGILILTGIPSNWFLKYRGLASGITWSSTFFGATLTTNTIAHIVSIHSWQMACTVMGVIAFVVIFLASFFLKWRPQDVGLYPDGMTTEEAALESEKAGSAKVVGLNRIESVKTPAFWIIFAGLFMIGFAEMGPAQSMPSFIISNGGDLGMAAMLMSLGTLIGLIAKITAGFVIDKIGARWAFLVIEALAAAGLLMLAFATQNADIAYLIVGVALFNIGDNCAIVCFSVGTSLFFGAKHYAAVFGIIFMGNALGVAFGVPFLAQIGASEAGWTGAFVAAAIVAMLAAAVFFFARKSPLLISREQEAAASMQKEIEAKKG